MKKLFSVLFFFSAIMASAQDLYIKSYSSNSVVFGNGYNTSIEALNDDSYVVAGHMNSSNTIGRVFIRMFNKCGNEVWHKQISDSVRQMTLVSLNIDSSQNILISGLYDEPNQAPKPYLIKLNKNGSIVFSKLLGSVNSYNHLTYSTSIAANGDYVMYGMHRYTPSPPNNEKISICRLDSNGIVKWAKNYDFSSRTWGRLTATRDNGALAFTSNTIYKTDSLGNIEWSNEFSAIGYLYAPIETDSSYIFGRYRIGAIDRGSFFEIKKDGSLGWKTDNFMNFYPEGQGTLLRNGNVMFSGSNRLTGNGLSFIEIDFNTGNTISHKRVSNTAVSNGIISFNLTETSDSNLVFAGQDNRGILQQLAIGKINKSSGTIICGMNTIMSQQDPFNITENGSDAAVVNVNNDYTIVNKSFTVNDLSSTNFLLDCGYTSPRGNHTLGNDTILCRGQSITLGIPASTFDAYLWSNTSSNKTISINQSGTYWLQVISACDTLRDSINVYYMPGILFSIGPDTIVCSDSLILGSGLDSSINYVWSTGETTKSITVKSSGFYWVEHINKCNSTRASILVTFYPRLPAIDLGVDTILCPGETILLGDPNSPYTAFNWSNGTRNKLLQVNSAGNYWLLASDICNESIDTIRVDYHPEGKVNLGTDSSFCAGGSIVLGNANPLHNYLWSTGVSTPSIVVSSPGMYWLETQTICGPVRDYVRVTIVAPLVAPTLMNDTSVCKESTIQLTAGNLENYLWSNGSTSSFLVTKDTGVFWVETKNRCDTLRDSVRIARYPSLNFDYTVSPTEAFSGDSISFINTTIDGSNPVWEFGNGATAMNDSVFYEYVQVGTYNGSLTLISSFGCEERNDFSIWILISDFYIPTVFTPNDDGINDLFFPVGKDIKSYTISIFNNWGMKISNKSFGPWNGVSINGRRANVGSFVYIMNVEFNNGEIKKYVGQVNLMR
jgi:gliding motility-associated-like protein